jgi:ABC-type multidrug transport system fused ATPase/permease subunit
MWRGLLAILDADQRLRFAMVVLVCQVNVVAELFGLGAVFLLARSILSNVGNSHGTRNSILGLHFSATPEMLPLLAIGVGFAYLLKLSLGIATAHLRAGFVQRQHAIFSERLLNRYLQKGWLFFLRHNAAILTQHITADCARLATGVLSEFIIVITETCMIVALFVALAFISWSATATMLTFVVMITIGFQITIRPWAHRMAVRSHFARLKNAQIVDMAIRGAKEVVLYHRIDYFIDRLRGPLREAVHVEAVAQTLREAPRHVFEFLAVLMLMSVVAVESWQGQQRSAIALIVALFAAASLRLVASVSRMSASWASMNTHRAMFVDLQPDLLAPSPRGELTAISERPIEFRREIELRRVSFKHEGATRRSIDDVSFTLGCGTRLGIVGTTGAGKSTLMELLLGVLPPQAGEIIIDDAPLCASTRRSWQEKISYVPQSPTFLNDTVVRNIAFGIRDEDVDMSRVQQAARVANILQFIEGELPNGYDTVIGDRGTSLSVGQQQRLAIARALYRQPKLIVLDEATSALDNVTEAIVNEAIVNFSQDMTAVIVAHRLSTVCNCDRILVLDRGRVIQDGTFEQLSKETGQFQQQLEHARLGDKAERLG